MLKVNVICKECGAKLYNPNVPLEHVIDTCSNKECIKASKGVIGFKNGDIQNCSVANLYKVDLSVVYGAVATSESISSSQIEINDKIAKINYFTRVGEFSEANQLLKDDTIKELPVYDYLRSLIFFKKAKNTSVGTKLLKSSSEAGYPRAKAEYGFIIAMGVYGTLKDPNKGIKLLLEAYDQGVPVSTVYLSNIYWKGDKHSQAYKEIEDSKWFEIVNEAVDIVIGIESHMILGYMYGNGIGTEVDIDKACYYLEIAADDGYVVACYIYVNMFLNNRLHIDCENLIEKAKKYCEYYLGKSSNKEINEYYAMESMYQDVLDLLT